ERERAVAELRPQERLLAEAVAREHEPVSAGVPERDREHPVEALDERGPVLLVEVRDHRCVSPAADVVAALGELASELGEVVELAVEDGDDVAALARDGLVAELGIQNLEPLVAEHARAEGVSRSLIG